MSQLIHHPWLDDELGPLRWQVADASMMETVNREAAAYVADKYRIQAADVALAVKGRQVSAITATYHLLDKKLRRLRVHQTGRGSSLSWRRLGNDSNSTMNTYPDESITETVSECNSNTLSAVGSSSVSSPRPTNQTHRPAEDLLRPLPMAKQTLKVAHKCDTREYRDSQPRQTRGDQMQGRYTNARDAMISTVAPTHSPQPQNMRAQGKSVTFSFNADQLSKINLTPRDLHILSDRFAVVHSADRPSTDWVYSSAEHPICVEGIPRLRLCSRTAKTSSSVQVRDRPYYAL